MDEPIAGSLHHVELWVPNLGRAGPRQRVDELAADGPAHGWTLLFPDRHPYAGGPGHYAAYLASTDNFEVELVAAEP
jgi:hypothetical protein